MSEVVAAEVVLQPQPVEVVVGGTVQGPAGADGHHITISTQDAVNLSQTEGDVWLNKLTSEVWVADAEPRYISQGVLPCLVPPPTGSMVIMIGASPNTVGWLTPTGLFADATFAPAFNTAFDSRIATTLITALDATGFTLTSSEITDFITASDARIAAASIDDLSDVDTTGVTGGELLVWRTSPSAGYVSEVLSENLHHFEADWAVDESVVVPFPWVTGRFYSWHIDFEKSGYHRVLVEYSLNGGGSWTSLGWTSATGTSLEATPDQIVSERALLRFTLTDGLVLDDARFWVTCWRSS